MSKVERSAPLVTVVMPARNEAADVSGAIESLGQQDLALVDIEVLVVDGGSTDGTGDIARRSLARYGFARGEVLENPAASTPSNLNRGLADARAPYLFRVDARSRIPADYLRNCLDALRDHPERSVVGGGQQAWPRTERPAQVGVARALNNRWTMGLAKYRRGGESGPSDTVYLGAFRTAELHSVGGWDERLATNQDFDLNRRMARLGDVWFLGDIPVGYLPRAGHRQLFRQYRRFGSWKVTYWRQTADRPRPRQVAALATLPLAATVGVGWLRSPRRLRLVAASAAVAGIAIVEGRGTTGPHGSVSARCWSVAAIACVWGGWSLGAWESLLGGVWDR